jgi:hypothetical protein
LNIKTHYRLCILSYCEHIQWHGSTIWVIDIITVPVFRRKDIKCNKIKKSCNESYILLIPARYSLVEKLPLEACTCENETSLKFLYNKIVLSTKGMPSFRINNVISLFHFVMQDQSKSLFVQYNWDVYLYCYVITNVK